MSDMDKTGSFFWSTLEQIIRPQPRPGASQNSDIQSEQSLRNSTFSLHSSNESTQETSSDEIYKRLNVTPIIFSGLFLMILFLES